MGKGSLTLHRCARTSLAFALSACLVLILGVGCETQTQILEEGETDIVIESPQDVTPPPVDSSQTVCDPFANNPSYPATGRDHGIVSRLFYLTNDQPRYSRVADYLANGHHVEATLFLSQINVPTRKFDMGFVTESGELLTSQNGDKLYEYFGLQMESVIALAPDDSPGEYQLGLLADDGAILEADFGQGYEVLVNDDGTHATKMACAPKTVTMDHNTRIPVRVSYYQGPRYHIALMTLWRKVDLATQSLADPTCGKSGNDLFFDYNVVPSAPKKAYNDLLARGWAPIPAKNFQLPDSVASNPCTSPTPKTIVTKATPEMGLTNQKTVTVEFTSNYDTATFTCSLDGVAPVPCTSPMTYSGLSDGEHKLMIRALNQGRMDPEGALVVWKIDTVAPIATTVVHQAGRTTATITWVTDEAATSMVRYGIGVNLTFATAEDAVLKTSHTVMLTDLLANTIYYYSAQGHDKAGNAYESTPRAFRTSR